MTPPKFVFVDTSAFEAKGYSLNSELFESFASACRESGTVLLVPLGIEREIERRMLEQGGRALEQIATALRKTHFLETVPNWPKPFSPITKYHVQIHTREFLEKFWKKFTTIRLGYETASIAEVMGWYQHGEGPFGDGKKKHEFPDAIATSSLLGHARGSASSVAVISADQDFKRACERHNELLYFSSVAAFTEALLDHAAQLERFREILTCSEDALHGAIWEYFPNLSFRSSGARDVEIVDVEMEDVNDLESRIIAIGEKEFTIDFAAVVGFSARVNYYAPSYSHNQGSAWTGDWLSGKVFDHAAVYGLAKLAIDANQTSATVLSFDLEPNDIDVNELPDDADRF